MKLARLLLLPMIAAGLFACATQPTLQTGPDAEITFDGLTRLDSTIMDAVWIREDLDLSQYSKIVLLGAGIQYRPVSGPESGSTRNRMSTSTDSEFPLSDEAKERFREVVGQAFRDELAKSDSYEIVERPGRDVLAVTGGLFDVVSNVPPQAAGRGDIYLSRVGEATLVLELRDSMSGAILARAVDRRAAEPTTAMRMSTVTNWSEARRLANRWAILLRNGLESLMATSPSS